MSTSQLMVQGKQLTLPQLPNIRTFLAAKAGVTLPATVKGTPGPTVKEVVALCIAAGSTAEQVKVWRTELDAERKQHYVHSGMAVAMLAADPSIRKSVRESRNKAGDVIGYNATFRKERSASMSGAVRIAQLEALVTQLQARLALPAA